MGRLWKCLLLSKPAWTLGELLLRAGNAIRTRQLLASGVPMVEEVALSEGDLRRMWAEEVMKSADGEGRSA